MISQQNLKNKTKKIDDLKCNKNLNNVMKFKKIYKTLYKLLI